MYIIRKEKVNDLKQGRTVIYLADKIGITRPYLSAILNGRVNASQEMAEKIIATCFLVGPRPQIEDFFKKI